jgi:hypothetical protein
MDRDPNAFRLAAQLRDCIGIHVGKQPRQHLEDRDPSARPGVDVTEFEGDHATTDKDDARR